MTRTKQIWLVVGLMAIAIATAACNDDNPAASIVSGSGLGTGNDRVTVVADPQEVVINLEDPDTPTDPGTGEGLGETMITALIRDEAGEPEDEVEVSFKTDGGELKSGGEPVMTNEMGVAMDTLIVSESDEGEVSVQAAVGEDRNTTTVTVTVDRPNSPPVADAGPDQTVDCGVDVTLDGSGSTDDDDIVSYKWTEGMMELGEGEMLTIPSAGLGAGMHTITLTVTDSEGDTDSDDTVVTVVDDSPPEVMVSLNPAMIWPPNHKWVSVHASLRSADACTAVEDLTVVLLSVESNEPPNANGDGNTEPDIRGVEIGTADYDFSVRAERAGPGSGRVYTATYIVTDTQGNSTTESAEARVPHDQGGN